MDATHSTDAQPAPVVTPIRFDGDELRLRVDRGPVSTWHTVTWTRADGIHAVGHDLDDDVADACDELHDAIDALARQSAADERADYYAGLVA